MKKNIKHFISFLIETCCKIAVVLWPYKRYWQFRRFKTKIHTNWIKNEFKSFGNFSSISYPINLKGGGFIIIGSRVGIGKECILNAWDRYGNDTFSPTISIGDNTYIGEDAHITAINKIVIGDNVLMGKKVTITDNSHGKFDISISSVFPKERQLFSKGPVVIEDGVWIGDKVTILPNTRIGKNSIIGANALVTKDVPANCVVGGVPAVIIKRL